MQFTFGPGGTQGPSLIDIYRKAADSDYARVQQDISTHDRQDLGMDSMQLNHDAQHAGYTQLSTDANNIVQSLSNGTYTAASGTSSQNHLAMDMANIHQDGALSLDPGWGIEGGNAKAENLNSSLNTIFQDFESGNTQNLFQHSLQLSLDAGAAGKTQLSNDAQNIARSLVDGTFDMSASRTAMTDDKNALNPQK